jgi:hypothetical protein
MLEVCSLTGLALAHWMVAGEGDEPCVREEAEAVWHWRRVTAQEGPALIC